MGGLCVWRDMYVVLMVCMWHGSDRRICRSFHHTLFHSHLYTYTHTPTPHPSSPFCESPTPSSDIPILPPMHLSNLLLRFSGPLSWKDKEQALCFQVVFPPFPPSRASGREEKEGVGGR